jgi:hypothetical protein
MVKQRRGRNKIKEGYRKSVKRKKKEEMGDKNK